MSLTRFVGLGLARMQVADNAYLLQRRPKSASAEARLEPFGGVLHVMPSGLKLLGERYSAEFSSNPELRFNAPSSYTERIVDWFVKGVDRELSPARFTYIDDYSVPGYDPAGVSRDTNTNRETGLVTISLVEVYITTFASETIAHLRALAATNPGWLVTATRDEIRAGYTHRGVRIAPFAQRMFEVTKHY